MTFVIDSTEQFKLQLAMIYDMELHHQTEIEPTTRFMYGEFIKEVRKQFDDLRYCVTVKFVDYDPYLNFNYMKTDISIKRELKVWTGGNPHPIMNVTENSMFRAVHDYYGHFMTDSDFSWEGEEAAFFAHKKMFPDYLHAILAVETRLQSAWVSVENNPNYRPAMEGQPTKFPEQKVFIPPYWVTEPIKEN